VCLPADDVAQLRKLAADRDYQKSRADEAERQSSEWQKSASKWEALYVSEKKRADEIQGQRVQILTDQAAADRQKVGEQNAEIISLKSSRKWYFGAGVAAGAVAGYYIGKNRERIVQAVTPSSSLQPLFQPPPSKFNLGAAFRF
jgi:hypothetical protein